MSTPPRPSWTSSPWRKPRASLDGLKVAIIGDIAHSRVARSDIHAFTKMGSQVTVAGPATMLPPYLESLGARVTYSLEEAVAAPTSS